MTPRIACGLTAVTLLFAAPLAAQSESPDSLALGRKFTGWFVDGYADSLWNVMGEGTRGRIGSIENIESMMDQIIDQIGDEAEVVSESAKFGDDGVLEYRRLSEYDLAPEPIVWIWRINDEGKIVGVRILPESQAPPAN
ncbi:MAG: hypothetical protein E2O47_03410 [Gemmatimonadetes bacterium]|nr:MAG: hypothetical protein E2O47_03410 [Gemmatimonadota bacterium]